MYCIYCINCRKLSRKILKPVLVIQFEFQREKEEDTEERSDPTSDLEITLGPCRKKIKTDAYFSDEEEEIT